LGYIAGIRPSFANGNRALKQRISRGKVARVGVERPKLVEARSDCSSIRAPRPLRHMKSVDEKALTFRIESQTLVDRTNGGHDPRLELRLGSELGPNALRAAIEKISRRHVAALGSPWIRQVEQLYEKASRLLRGSSLRLRQLLGA
jgi:hypothetical protein